MKNSNHTREFLIIPNDIFFKEVNDILNKKEDVWISVSGNSMRPFLSHQDKVLLSYPSSEKLTFGKIILAKYARGYVLHRLLWKNKDTIWLVGDNNLIQTEKINKGNILGYVKYAEINGKHININSASNIFLAAIWFLLRPLRLLYSKIRTLFS